MHHACEEGTSKRNVHFLSRRIESRMARKMGRGTKFVDTMAFNIYLACALIKWDYAWFILRHQSDYILSLVQSWAYIQFI